MVIRAILAIHNPAEFTANFEVLLYLEDVMNRTESFSTIKEGFFEMSVSRKLAWTKKRDPVSESERIFGVFLVSFL